jgi:hypothetical protein
MMGKSVHWRMPYRSRDASGESDTAEAVGWAWIDALAVEAAKRYAKPRLRIESPPLNSDGRAIVLLLDRQPLAAATIFRDDMNFAVLVRWVHPSFPTLAPDDANADAEDEGFDGMPPADEIRLLRDALVSYGDRVRMANAKSPELQQVIDRAMGPLAAVVEDKPEALRIAADALRAIRDWQLTDDRNNPNVPADFQGSPFDYLKKMANDAIRAASAAVGE